MSYDDDESDQLVDLSDPNAMVTAPDQYTVVVLERPNVLERWGFLTYNQRFPLTVGRVDHHRSHLLQKGDIIRAVDFTVPNSYESAAALVSRAQLRITLTIDRDHVAQASPIPIEIPSALSHMRSSAHVEGSSEQLPDRRAALPLPPTALANKTQNVEHRAGLSSPPATCAVPPMTLQPLRSNVDLVLRHLPLPPREAVYDRCGCPFGADMGFDDKTHAFLEQFLVDQSLKVASPNSDVRFDAITAVAGSGIARLPNELLKDVSLRGAEFIKKRDAAQCGTVERERFLAQMNALHTAMFDVKSGLETAKGGRMESHAMRLNTARETLAAYRQLCGDSAPTGPTALAAPEPNDTKTQNFNRLAIASAAVPLPMPMPNPFPARTPLPLAPPGSLTSYPAYSQPQAAMQIGAVFPVPSASPQSESGSCETHTSRKKRRRRERELAEMAAMLRSNR